MMRRYLGEIRADCKGGDVSQRSKGVEEDLVHALNYERHRRVASIFSSTKHNLHKALIVEVYIHNKLFVGAFLHNNCTDVISIALVCDKHYNTDVYYIFSYHVDVVV
jgi:hypothetical protein